MARARRQKVLVVDDDPSVRAMLGFLLDDEGYEVKEASDGVEAMDALLLEQPDAMVLDLMMPNTDGVTVLRQRRKRGFAVDTRILVLTAKSDARTAVECWELGAHEYLEKPVDPERLVHHVRVMLGRSVDELERYRQTGLADARERDRLEAAFDGRAE